ncbi:RNA polymerase sigma factor [Fulvivirga sp. RKSG066]|uniref:RNA polymerase sigma factor n=1 Tax=Fulvivirga aurantia TaxID=2529383 RepID=UPI0012BC493B|nr:RNA polymerase sigma factor [Fulvivirga aurantia]MTI21464.1 RNA polymerase sigma factor [Fulvivirga aurantia]
MSKKQEALFEYLYREFYPMVKQMCLGYAKGDEAIASDLTQEVFINCWRAVESFRGDSGHKTWLYRITVNTCLQYIRKEKKLEQVKTEASGWNETTDHTPDEVLNKRLYEAIGQLKEIDRLMIMMVLEEQEYDEISEVLGISEVNLRVKIHRVKKRLEKLLTQTK